MADMLAFKWYWQQKLLFSYLKERLKLSLFDSSNILNEFNELSAILLAMVLMTSQVGLRYVYTLRFVGYDSYFGV